MCWNYPTDATGDFAVRMIDGTTWQIIARDDDTGCAQSVGSDPRAAARHHRALRRGPARGGLSRASLRGRLPRLRGACPPLALAAARERRLTGRPWLPGGRN